MNPIGLISSATGNFFLSLPIDWSGQIHLLEGLIVPRLMGGRPVSRTFLDAYETIRRGDAPLPLSVLEDLLELTVLPPQTPEIASKTVVWQALVERGPTPVPLSLGLFGNRWMSSGNPPLRQRCAADEQGFRIPIPYVTQKGGWRLQDPFVSPFGEEATVIAQRSGETLTLRRSDQMIEGEEPIWKERYDIFVDEEQVGTLSFRDMQSILVLQSITMIRYHNEGIASAAIKWIALRAASQNKLLELNRITHRWIEQIVKAETIFDGPVLREPLSWGFTLRGLPARHIPHAPGTEVE